MTQPMFNLLKGDNLTQIGLIPNDFVDAIITDPPYGFEDDGSDRKNMGRYQGSKVDGGTNEWKELSLDWNKELPLEWIGECVRVLKPGGAIIAFTDCLRPHLLWEEYQKCGIKPLRFFYWIKTNPPTNPSKSFMSSVEVAVFGRKEGKVIAWNGKSSTPNVYQCPKVDGFYKIHPTQKPIRLMAHLVGLVSDPGHIILDPFSGSGSTGVASLSIGRGYLGIEENEEYFNESLVRLERVLTQSRLF